MVMKVVFPDGEWFIGDRRWWYPWLETRGTHHYKVLDGSGEFKKITGFRVAVPIGSVKYFILWWR